MEEKEARSRSMKLKFANSSGSIPNSMFHHPFVRGSKFHRENSCIPSSFPLQGGSLCKISTVLDEVISSHEECSNYIDILPFVNIYTKQMLPDSLSFAISSSRHDLLISHELIKIS